MTDQRMVFPTHTHIVYIENAYTSALLTYIRQDQIPQGTQSRLSLSFPLFPYPFLSHARTHIHEMLLVHTLTATLTYATRSSSQTHTHTRTCTHAHTHTYTVASFWHTLLLIV